MLFLDLSCPAISHNWAFIFNPFISYFFSPNSTPSVAFVSCLYSFFKYLPIKFVFPTPYHLLLLLWRCNRILLTYSFFLNNVFFISYFFDILNIFIFLIFFFWIMDGNNKLQEKFSFWYRIVDTNLLNHKTDESPFNIYFNFFFMFFIMNYDFIYIRIFLFMS